MVGRTRLEQSASTAGGHDWIELEACPICGESDSAPFEALPHADEPVEYQLCKRCGTVYQSPRMSEAALEGYYQSEYVTSHQQADGVSEKELRVQSGRARHLLHLLRAHAAHPKRHLDIGSSAGVLMETVRDAYGSEVVGIEPAAIYRQYAADRGLRTFAGLDELEADDARGFDLITMAHVLEHLPDPVGYLAGVREKWLEPAGFLLVEVPNLFGHFSLERPHLFCFHAATLRRALGEAGFEAIGLSAHGAPRSRLIPLYLTALARPASGLSSLRIRSSAGGVRLRRKLGMLWHRLATRFATRWAWLPLPELRLEG